MGLKIEENKEMEAARVAGKEVHITLAKGSPVRGVPLAFVGGIWHIRVEQGDRHRIETVHQESIEEVQELPITVEVTCNKCGRVAMAVENEYAARNGGLENYRKCVGCGGSYKNFRLAKAGDCPDGCTISGILHFDD